MPLPLLTLPQMPPPRLLLLPATPPVLSPKPLSPLAKQLPMLPLPLVKPLLLPATPPLPLRMPPLRRPSKKASSDSGRPALRGAGHNQPGQVNILTGLVFCAVK